MILKGFSKSKSKKNKITIFLYTYFFLTLSVFIFAVMLFMNTGFWKDNKNELIKRIHLNGIYNYKYIPNIVWLTITNFFTNLETLELNISQKDQIILEKNRKEKVDDMKKDFVSAKATIEINNQSLETDIRLKGDRSIHYENKENSSYKLNLEKNNFLNGLSSFSIQKPRIRNYIHEWIFHELSGELNLVKLKYDFVNLKINGEKKGLYVLEESFSNNLIEKNSRRAGPIFGLHEDFEHIDFLKAKLDPYQQNFWTRSENINFFLSAKEQIKELRDNNLSLDKIIDIQKWADYFALCDLLYTSHGYVPKSVKFYYNPINGLLEPIPFDGHKTPPYTYHPILEDVYTLETAFDDTAFDRIWSDFGGTWFPLFFLKNDGQLNTIFFKEYLNSIEKITNNNFLNEFFKERIQYINLINSKIYLDLNFVFDYATDRKSGIGIYYFDINEIYNRANRLEKKFNPNIKDIFFEDFGEDIRVSNKNYLNQRLKIKKFNCEKIIDNQKSNYNINFDKEVKFGDFQIKKNKNLICYNVVMEDIINKKIYNKKIDLNTSLSKNSIDENLFLKYFYTAGDNIYLKENDVIVEENLIIPSGYTVKISKGQSLNLINNSFIFSYSNWDVLASENKKIYIGGKEDNFGGGLFISSEEKNYFENVVFKNLRGLDLKKNIKEGGFIKTSLNENKNNKYFHNHVKNSSYENYKIGILLHGSLNIFNSNLNLKNVEFVNIASEDALNIMNSDFIINNCKFINIGSDAIDIDFGSGSINNSKFENISNDAVDFSGSFVELKNIKTNLVGDKSVSSGENSTISIKNLYINNSFVGVASKDGSKLNLDNIKIANTEIPIAVYTKKPSYSKSYLNINNIDIESSNRKFFVTNKNELFVDKKKFNQKISNSDLLRIIYRQNKEILKNYE